MKTMLEIIRTDDRHRGFTKLVELLDRELWDTLGPSQRAFAGFNKTLDRDFVIVLERKSRPVACGCFREFQPGAVEIKRMYVLPKYRGGAIAGILLASLEAWAREKGYTEAYLQTSTRLEAAVRFYRKNEYAVTEDYPPYVGMSESLCFRKELQPA